MNAHVPDCLVTGYADLIPAVSLPDPGDCHVLAAAIKTRAHVIVTYNRTDFPVEALAPYGIDVQHPDTFAHDLIDLAPAMVCAAVRRQRANLKNPPLSVQDLLDVLARQRLPEFVARLSEYRELL